MMLFCKSVQQFCTLFVLELYNIYIDNERRNTMITTSKKNEPQWLINFLDVTKDKNIHSCIKRLKSNITSLLKNDEILNNMGNAYELFFNLNTKEFFLTQLKSDNNSLNITDAGFSFKIKSNNLIYFIEEVLLKNNQKINEEEIIHYLLKDINLFVTKYYKKKVQQKGTRYNKNQYNFSMDWYNNYAFEQYDKHNQIGIVQQMLKSKHDVNINYIQLLKQFDQQQQKELLQLITNDRSLGFRYNINLMAFKQFDNFNDILIAILTQFIVESNSRIEAKEFDYETSYFKAYNDQYPEEFKKILKQVIFSQHKFISITKMNSLMALFMGIPNINENNILHYIQIKFSKNITALKQYNALYLDFLLDVNQLNYSENIEKYTLPFLEKLNKQHHKIFINQDSLTLLDHKIFELKTFNQYQNDDKLKKHLKVMINLKLILNKLKDSETLIVKENNDFMNNYDIVF